MRSKPWARHPCSPLFAAIDAVTSVPELARLLGRFARSGVGGLVGVDTESDPGDPNRYVMFTGQGGIGLPDEAYYRLEEHAAIREAYQTHLRTSLELAGVEHPADPGAAHLRARDRHRRAPTGTRCAAGTCGRCTT